MENKTLEVELAVKGMHCASCAARLERVLSSRSGVVQAEVQLVTERARLRVVPGTTIDSLCAAIADAGFEGSAIAKSKRLALGADEEAEFALASRRESVQVVLAALLTAPLIVPMLAMAFGFRLHLPPWVELLLATPVQFALGARFYVGAFRALKHRSANMDSLVALGTSAAFFYSLYSLLGDGAHGRFYFEASAVVITLVRLGKWFEAKAKRSTTSALRELIALQPERVLLRRTRRVDGQDVIDDQEVPIEQVEVGAVVVVRPGERFAADGVILEGVAAVDESMVTGESEPVARRVGDEVVSGSLNTNGLVVVQVTAIGEASTLGHIVALVIGAQAGKAHVQRLVDQVSAVFVPAVLVIALATFFGWLAITGEFRTALIAAVSVLVIACPCALGLATPTAIVVGTGAAARAGILVRDVDTLERARLVNTVVFDKTGTLTEGRPDVTRYEVRVGSEDELFRLAASVEAPSLHPYAQAIVRAARERGVKLGQPEQFESYTGQGVSAVIDGQIVRAGNLEWLGRCGVTTSPYVTQGDDSRIEIAQGSVHIGTIYVSDPIRSTTAEGLQLLSERGIRSIVVSGDQTEAVERFARAVGLDEAVGRVRPEEKLERVRALSTDGRNVAMVGDGINDAPALAEAFVGIAMGTGTQVAVQAADIVLMRPDPRLVAATFDIAKVTFAKIRQNLFWAFFYNCIGIPLAASGRLSPMVAGLAMALSSVSVVSNSLLLRRWRPRQGGLASRAR